MDFNDMDGYLAAITGVFAIWAIVEATYGNRENNSQTVIDGPLSFLNGKI